ncbi:MFS transporter [Fluoribacter gormanii]|uniref:MFS transporter n=1 Tax=Fluoribacter gormanii TaxID=464 RepID=UPI001041AE3B|nr:MFS transporter [Fluoribacter gormanii]MCW8442921.1 MFS transporter [Fluoribacter gormanii]
MQKLYGTIVWLIATLFVVYSFCLNTAAAVFSEPIKNTLSASDYGVSIATGAFILGFACMQIPAGYLLDKFNPRIVVSGGILLLALGNIFISIADSLTIFTFANFIQGIGASFAFVAAAVLISQWFSAQIFPVLFGLTQTLSCILAGVLHYYFKVELISHTWNELYQWLAIAGLILFVLSSILVRSPSGLKRDSSISLKKSLAVVFKNKQIVLCSVAAATSFGVLLAYASLWFMPIQNYYSVDNLQSIIISGLIFVGIGIGTPLIGWFSNTVKSRIMVIHITLVTGTMVLLLGIYLPHYSMNSFIITKIVSFLIGFLLSGSMLFYTMVSEISSDSTRGVAISVLNTAVFLFNTLLLFIPYLFITTVSKDFFTYLWILPFCTLSSILLIYFIKDTNPE